MWAQKHSIVFSWPNGSLMELSFAITLVLLISSNYSVPKETKKWSIEMGLFGVILKKQINLGFE